MIQHNIDLKMAKSELGVRTIRRLIMAGTRVVLSCFEIIQGSNLRLQGRSPQIGQPMVGGIREGFRR